MSVPFNLALMDVDAFIRQRGLSEVRSTFIREPSSSEFNHEGLFSEYIFGEIGAPQRLVRHGYISLRTKVFHPKVWKIVTRLKGLYREIMEGKTYAIFDKVEHDFVKVPDTESGASTGFHFFLNHFDDIKFAPTTSITRKTRLKVLEQYKDRIFIDSCIVLPAALRDIKVDDATSSSEEINKLYSGMLNLARALPETGRLNSIYDPIRVGIQKKVVEVYEYIKNIVDGKNGFLQKKYGARNLALGTRNVLSAAITNSARSDDPKFIKSDETQVPLYQSMKAAQPAVVAQLQSMFFGSIFGDSATQISLIDSKTYQLAYAEIGVSDRDKFTTSDGIGDLITGFGNTDIRHNPVMVRDISGRGWYLYHTYLDGTDLYITRNAAELKRYLEEGGRTYDKANLHPMTWFEMFYIATYNATLGRHCMITRYPVTGQESIYPSKIHVVSTSVSRTVTLRSVTNPDVAMMLPRFPISGAGIDSISVHPSQLPNLGGD